VHQRGSIAEQFLRKQQRRSRTASIAKAATEEAMKFIEKNRHQELISYLKSLETKDADGSRMPACID